MVRTISWIGSEELATLQSDNQRFHDAAERLQATVRQQEEELRILRAAQSILPAVGAAIHKLMDEGTIIEVATTEAQAEVVRQEERKLIAEKKRELLASEGPRWATQYRQDHEAEITTDLKEELEADGSFALVHQQAEAEVTDELRTELFVAEKAKITAQLQEPEQREAILAKLRAKIHESNELARYRKTERTRLEGEWSPAVVAEAQAAISDEEAARHDEFVASTKKHWLASREGVNHRSRIRASLEAEWERRALSEVAEELNDTELQALLTKRAEQEKSQLTEEIRARELLAKFETTGIAASDIPTGSVVDIYLGTVGIKETGGNRSSNYPYDTTPKRTTAELACTRKLSLLAMGGSQFEVAEDSLNDATGPHAVYVKDNALEPGTVITIGRKITANGHETLDPTIRAGVHLHYDTDTTKDGFVDAAADVANVVVDGISARHIDKVTMAA